MEEIEATTRKNSNDTTAAPRSSGKSASRIRGRDKSVKELMMRSIRKRQGRGRNSQDRQGHRREIAFPERTFWP